MEYIRSSVTQLLYSIKIARHMMRGKAKELKLWIQKNTFWVKVKATVNFFSPLVKILPKFDCDSPQQGWLYWSLKRGVIELSAKMEDCVLVWRVLLVKFSRLKLRKANLWQIY